MQKKDESSEDTTFLSKLCGIKQSHLESSAQSEQIT